MNLVLADSTSLFNFSSPPPGTPLYKWSLCKLAPISLAKITPPPQPPLCAIHELPFLKFVYNNCLKLNLIDVERGNRPGSQSG